MNQRLPYLLIAAFLAGCWTFLVQNDPFFWDTVQLASKHAHFFYENHLQWAPLPVNIDSGHPPLLGYYLAILWTLFGKSLAVSHWAIWPFLTGVFYVSGRIGQRITGTSLGWLLPVLLCSDPVVAGQSALVSPDTIVVCGLLCAVYGIQYAQKGLVLFGILLLCATSMRGMMVTAALGVWVLLLYPFQWKKIINDYWTFLPGIALGVGFLLWHYSATGWIGHFEGSTWSAAFERADARGMVRNFAILGWRWTDMNRFAEWLLLIGLVYKSGWKICYREQRAWILLLACLILFLSPSAVLYKNLSAHRYFLPVFAALHVLVFAALWRKSAWENTRKRTVALVLSFVLALGNLWIYPKGVSMDWDSTLAHWPYHQLRSTAMTYLEQQHIPLEDVGTTFPNVNTNENLLLNGDQRSCSDLNFEKNKWVMASNIFNDIDEPEYEQLNAQWKLEQRWESKGVWIELWRRADFSPR